MHRSGNSRSANDNLVLPEWCLTMIRSPLGLAWRVLFHMSFKGAEHIPSSGGVIVAANHQTYIDPFWLAIPIKRPIRFLAWKEAFSWPIVGKIIQLMGAWPLQIERSDPATIRRTLQWLTDGNVIVIFPEGGRGAPEGTMYQFKAGAVRLAMEAGVPILPVTIRGGHRVWPSGRMLPRLAQVEIIYHEPFKVQPQCANEETRACARRETERLKSIIQSAL